MLHLKAATVKNSITVFLLLFLLRFAAGQDTDLRKFNYALADSIALHLPKIKYKSYGEVANLLTDNLKTEQEKFRAIFRWIAENIRYNYWLRTSNARTTFIEKKSACGGYASLLAQMCQIAGIDCEEIAGWAKVDSSDIGQKMKEPNHAWDVVKINNVWHLTDVTWAAGYYNLKHRKFTKDFDTTYFLPTPKFFIKQHFPQQKKWQLLPTPVKKRRFKKSYLWYPACATYGINIVSPINGALKQNIKKDFTLIIKLNNPLSIADSMGAFTFIIDDGKEQQSVELVNASSTGQIVITCSFPDNLKGTHTISVFYYADEIAKYNVTFY